METWTHVTKWPLPSWHRLPPGTLFVLHTKLPNTHWSISRPGWFQQNELNSESRRWPFLPITAADLKKGSIIMFDMGSSSPGRVAPRADQCLGGQFACASMSYSMFSTIVDTTQGCLGGGCGVCFGDEIGFHIGFNIKLPWGKLLPSTTVHTHGISDMMTSWTLMSSYSHCRPPFGTSIMGDATVPWFGPIPPIGRQGTQKWPTKWFGWWRRGCYAGNDGCNDRRQQRRCDRLHRGR